MTSEALLFTLSAIGISETVYLVKKRRWAQKPICIVGEDCTKVLESKYSNIFVIPNDILGLLFYIALSLIASLLVIEIPPFSFWNAILGILILSGSLVSLFLTYLQFQVIKSWCFWCLMSAATIWSMAFIVIVNSFFQ